MQRMSTEVTRSTVNYRRQNKGKSLQSIFLTGRGALLNGFSDYYLKSKKYQLATLTLFRVSMSIFRCQKKSLD